MPINRAFAHLYRKWVGGIVVLLLVYGLWLVAVPVHWSQKPYCIVIPPNQSLQALAKQLDQDQAIRSRTLMVILARLLQWDTKIQAGRYVFKSPTNLIGMLNAFAAGKAEQLSITFVEGITFDQMRQTLNQAPYLQHDSQHLSHAQLLIKIGAKNSGYAHPEGLFFPSTYFYEPQVSDLTILRQAYQNMQKILATTWQHRAPNLPYRTPYELLIMASLIEKETGYAADRAKIAAVFINRLRINMRLQTDPAVMYGISTTFSGSLTHRQLRRNTRYNTYIHAGLTPTPIALPGLAALEAAAHPDPRTKAFYFVARQDGLSVFSHNLKEHNAAVRKYILHKGK
ncbi:MAG: endolytic transglycosylase MltG [Neisseriales bacterium]|nr:MAG: endolytic transglycosylase MltG [Neisseriales bacterium]